MSHLTLKEINKKMFVEKDFLTVFKSILTLPVFVQRNSTNIATFEKEDFMGYKKVIIKSKSLNLDMDFQVFVFVYIESIKAIANGQDKINFNINDFYEFVDGRDENGLLKNKSNHNKKTFNKVVDSLQNIKTFSMRVEDYYNNGFICSFINDPVWEGKEFSVEINKNFMNLFNVDANSVFNINLSFFNSLSKDYSKIIYLTLLANSMNAENTITLEKIANRMRETNIDKKYSYNVREAFRELQERKFVANFKEVKDVDGVVYKYATNKVKVSNVLPVVKEKKPKKIKQEKMEPEMKQEQEVVTDISGFEDDSPWIETTQEEVNNEIVYQEEEFYDDEIAEQKLLQSPVVEEVKQEEPVDRWASYQPYVNTPSRDSLF